MLSDAEMQVSGACGEPTLRMQDADAVRHRRLRDLCKRMDCQLCEEPKVWLRFSSDGTRAQAVQLMTAQALEWLSLHRAQLSNVMLSMLTVFQS